MLVTFNPYVNRVNQSSRAQNFGSKNDFYRAAVHNSAKIPSSYEDIFKAIENDPKAAIGEGGVINKVIAEIERMQSNSGTSRQAEGTKNQLTRALSRFQAQIRSDSSQSGLFNQYGKIVKRLDGRS